MQGASLINRQWADADAIADQFHRFGITTKAGAENATDAEWDMAATLAGCDMRPDEATRRIVATKLDTDEKVDEAGGDVFATLIPQGAF